MTSLFTPFDIGIFYSSFILLSLLIPLMILKVHTINSFYFFKDLMVYKMLGSFFMSLKPKGFNKMSLLTFSSLLLCIFFINIFSVFSYSFPTTSQAGMILGVSLILWISVILFSGCNNFKALISHFIPEGAPLVLSFFLFLIELISSVIRPVTMTVRLVSNILAGHLLMILLSQLVFLQAYFYPFYIALNLVEMFVGFIQSYIITTMIVLYFSEVH